MNALPQLNRNLYLCCAIAVTSMCTSCGGQRQNDPVIASPETLSLAIEEAVTNTIIPSIERFEENSNALRAQSDEFCNTISETHLISLQSQWISTFHQWYRVSNYLYGPASDDIIFPPYTFIDSLRLRGTNYLETVRSEINNNIVGDHALDDAFFNNRTFQNVGLLAIETAIFETASADHSKTISNIIAEYELEPRKCALLTGLTQALNNKASYIVDGWKNSFMGFEASYESLFISDELDDGTPAVTQLIVGVQEYLEHLQARNVVNVASPLSEQSWNAISESIDEIETLLNGTDSTAISLLDLMESTGNTNAVEKVRLSIENVRASIAANNVELLEIALGQLDGNFKREIPQSLDVELGINFSDGD